MNRLFWNPADESAYWRWKGIGRLAIAGGLILQLVGGLLYGIGLLWYRAALEGAADPRDD